MPLAHLLRKWLFIFYSGTERSDLQSERSSVRSRSPPPIDATCTPSAQVALYFLFGHRALRSSIGEVIGSIPFTST
ncbi:MAG: hypothetical protein ABIQ74_05300, partial [Chitinophagales bacterium]